MPLSVTNLVGFGAKRAAAGGGADSLTFVGSSTSTSGGILSFHASAAAGDLAIVADFFDDTTSLLGRASPPSGWSLFDDLTTDSIDTTGGSLDCRGAIYYKVLTSGDITTGSVDAGLAGGDVAEVMACIILRPSSTPTLSHQEVALTADGSAASVTASSGTPFVLVVGATCGRLMSGESPAFDNTATADDGTHEVELGVTVYSSSPADQSVDDDGATPSGNEFYNICAYSNVTFA